MKVIIIFFITVIKSSVHHKIIVRGMQSLIYKMGLIHVNIFSLEIRLTFKENWTFATKINRISILLKWYSNKMNDKQKKLFDVAWLFISTRIFLFIATQKKNKSETVCFAGSHRCQSICENKNAHCNKLSQIEWNKYAGMSALSKLTYSYER